MNGDDALYNACKTLCDRAMGCAGCVSNIENMYCYVLGTKNSLRSGRCTFEKKMKGYKAALNHVEKTTLPKEVAEEVMGCLDIFRQENFGGLN